MKNKINWEDEEEVKEYYKKYNKEHYNKEYHKEYHKNPKVKERVKEYEKREDIKKKRKEYAQQPKIKKKRKEYIKEYHKEYNQKPKVKEKNKEYMKKYHQKAEVKERVKGHIKKHYEKNKKEILRKQYKYIKNKKKNNPNFKLSCLLRVRVNDALKRFTKGGKIYSSKKYGIDYQAIINHLKPLPKNLKDYEIHHIKPLFTFNFINENGLQNLEEIKKAFSPKNHKLILVKEHRKINHRNLI